VAAIAPALQAKLLRVLEERTFQRLGGNETLRINARLMALTNTDLPQAVAAGRFREDLFFRLNVLAIPIPPLRERRDDITPLTQHFLERFAPVYGHKAEIEPAAQRLLESYEWPGNARELKNAMEHALIFSADKNLPLQVSSFPGIVKVAGNTHSARAGLRSLEELETEAIRITLEQTHYKIGESAKILGISRKTLLEKRKKYDLI
jgi:transcriptional regulator with PAS, ATPase and Fis domain